MGKILDFPLYWEYNKSTTLQRRREISDSAVVCPHCGVQIAEFKKSASKQTCTMAIVGFVLSFLVSVAGLICSIIARKKCREENLEGGGLALAGIIISAVSIGFTVIYLIAIIATSCAALSYMGVYY